MDFRIKIPMPKLTKLDEILRWIRQRENVTNKTLIEKIEVSKTNKLRLDDMKVSKLVRLLDAMDARLVIRYKDEEYEVRE